MKNEKKNRTSGRTSESIYTFTAEAQDNKARLRCEASNVISEKPLKKEIDMNVIYPPSQVTINGPTEARVGEKVHYQCVTAPSNPPAEIRWAIDGKQVNASTQTTPGKDDGMISNSSISFPVKANKRSFMIVCHGINMDLAENVYSTHTLNILCKYLIRKKRKFPGSGWENLCFISIFFFSFLEI